MELDERFKYIMKLNQLSASAFAEEIGVQRSSVSHVLSGRNKPSLEFIHKVLKRFPKVDANWLINGSTAVEKDQFEIRSEEPGAKISLDSSKESLAKSETEKKEEQEDSSYEPKNNRERSIRKVLVFYTDGTFEEFTSVLKAKK
ncbi:MAG: helix-turn-helix transcriptional regulator [Vicingaceae bacterium]